MSCEKRHDLALFNIGSKGSIWVCLRCGLENPLGKLTEDEKTSLIANARKNREALNGRRKRTDRR